MKDDYDIDRLRPMLLEANGNVRKVAKAIGADSEDLRNFVMNTPVLRRALDEVIARGVDGAITALFDALEDDNPSARIAASKEFLKSRAGQRRGFHQNKELDLKAAKGGSLTLTWLQPEEKPDPKLIEGTKET